MALRDDVPRTSRREEGTALAGTNRRAAPARSRRGTRTRPASSATAATTGAAGVAPRKRKFFDYPRSGYTGLHRWLPSWRFVLGSFVTLVFLMLGGAVAAYNSVTVPDTNADVKAQTTTVYFAPDAPDQPHGEVMGTFQIQKRTLVELPTLPPYVGKAVIAAEDKTFETNSGVDPVGMARAFLNNVRGGKTQGGSTLTQQYVERYYFSTTTDYVGKAREALLALKLARTLEKDEILERYLNTIYFGRDSYGIEAAAQSYFGKGAKDLSVSEAAVLAGIIPSPNNWDPAVSPEKAEARWNYVLDNMVDIGALPAAERATLVFPSDTLIPEPASQSKMGPNGLLLQMVKKELGGAPLKMSEDDINRAGMSVVTTIRKPLQDMAVATADGFRAGTLEGQDGAAPVERTKFSITSIDPQTGGIVAMYGGPNNETDQRNHATYENVQGASTFKPFTLVAALENGISLNTTYNGRSGQKFPEWEGGTKPVGNFDNENFGNIDLVTATAKSVNTVFAQLNIQVGADKTADVAARAGVPGVNPQNLSNVLGTDAIHPVDLAGAYATFANQGVKFPVHVVATVTNPDGTTAYQAPSEGERVFQADVMADATYAMEQVVEQGSGRKWIKPLGRPIAGKTGTTNDNKAAWFVGFTPDLATAVSISQKAEDQSDESITGFGGVKHVTGSTWPAFVWQSYMKQAFTLAPYSEVKQFPTRSNVGKKPSATPTVEATPTEAPTEAPPEPQVVDVPNVEGKLEADATATIDGLGLVVVVQKESSDTVTTGRVIRADPRGGQVPVGSTVTIVVSTGPKPQPTQPPPTPQPTPQPTQANAGGGNGGNGG